MLHFCNLALVFMVGSALATHAMRLLLCAVAAYLMQYMPQLAWIVLKKIGPKRAKALSVGKSGYDLQGFIRQ